MQATTTRFESTRRQFLGGLASALLPAAAQSTSSRPNIVFLLTDDQRWDSLGCMGNRVIQTPNIDALSAEGVTFTNQFVTTSICMSSRASIFTGQYERTHGKTQFSGRFNDAEFANTYMARLRAAGYRTGFIGKYGLDGQPLPTDRFDFWRGFRGQGRYLGPGDKGPHLTRTMGDQALEFLDSSPSEKPFFLQVSFKAAHVQDEDPRQFIPDPATADMYRDVRFPLPKTADPKYLSMLPIEVHHSENRRRWAVRFSTPELYQQSVRNYYRLISEVDREVGRIRQMLKNRNQSENTVIIFSSDNGFYLSEHGLAGKWIPHEESLRVPLIVYDPRAGNALRGKRRLEMTLNIDIAPTILRTAGLPVPTGVQGRDLAPLLQNSAGAGASWRKEFFYEHDFSNGWIPRTEGIRDTRWKYIRYLDIQPLFEELYDLSADPEETNNLARNSRYSGELERLRGRWKTWRDHLSAYTVQQPWAEPA